jgi:uncharacterized protein YjbI with pentapeptide repeats
VDLSPSTIWLIVGIYFLVSGILVTALPGRAAPTKAGTALANTDVDVIDLKNKVRQTVLQVCGAIGVLFSVYMAITTQNSANNDLKAKYDRETAELFVKAVESQSPQALYSLTYVAQRDSKNYHETIYQMLSSLIRSNRAEACREQPDDLIAAKGRLALRLLHERPTGNDTPGVHYNIEHSCLNGSDISVEQAEWGKYKGLVGIRASGSSMLRIDFSKAELQGAEFMGIAAGDVHNPGWNQEPHRLNLNELDDKGNAKYRAERRKFVAHFIDVNLTGALFDGAGLEGADFSGAVLGGVVFDGANISRVSFRGARHLVVDQLLAACVDDANSQPYLDEPLRSQVVQRGGVPICK